MVDPVATAAAIDASGNPDTTINYTAPGLSANGMPGTSPDAAGVFARQNTAFYFDTEYELGSLLLQTAFRLEDFSDFGTTSNYKVAGRYALGNLATLRGGYSTGFRAPTPGQSNYTGVTTSFDGVTGMQVQEGTLKPTDPLCVALGGKALEPETASNLSAGFTTSMIDGLNLSIDYYQIDLTSKIIKSIEFNQIEILSDEDGTPYVHSINDLPISDWWSLYNYINHRNIFC